MERNRKQDELTAPKTQSKEEPEDQKTANQSTIKPGDLLGIPRGFRIVGQASELRSLENGEGDPLQFYRGPSDCGRK